MEHRETEGEALSHDFLSAWLVAFSWIPMEWPLWVNLIRDKSERTAGIRIELYLESLTVGPLLRLWRNSKVRMQLRGIWQWQQLRWPSNLWQTLISYAQKWFVPSDKPGAKTPQGDAKQTAFQVSWLAHKCLSPAGPQRLSAVKVILRNKSLLRSACRVLRSVVEQQKWHLNNIQNNKDPHCQDIWCRQGEGEKSSCWEQQS